MSTLSRVAEKRILTKFWRVNRMVVGARMSRPRETDGHVTVSCNPVHSTKQPANPQVTHKFPPIRRIQKDIQRTPLFHDLNRSQIEVIYCKAHTAHLTLTPNNYNCSDAGDGIFQVWGSIPCPLMHWLLKDASESAGMLLAVLERLKPNIELAFKSWLGQT